jgi:hypothetical protein
MESERQRVLPDLHKSIFLEGDKAMKFSSHLYDNHCHIVILLGGAPEST